MTAELALDTAWRAGRLDARTGRKRVLFGRMYEDPAIERSAFLRRGRIFCIASAGCTALALAAEHDVVACDINPVQLDYAERRLSGAPPEVGTAERMMAWGRLLLPLAGWRASVIQEFLAMDDLEAQAELWKRRLATWRFRTGLSFLLSVVSLRAVYSPALLDVLPKRFSSVLQARMERCFRTHPNRDNPYVRALLVGDLSVNDRALAASGAASKTRTVELVLSDAASYLEGVAPGSFDGFTLSNILDGATPVYAKRLAAAVRHAARPGANVVLRSFREPVRQLSTNRAVEDRSMLWGIVDVRRADELWKAPRHPYGGWLG